MVLSILRLFLTAVRAGVFVALGLDLDPQLFGTLTVPLLKDISRRHQKHELEQLYLTKEVRKRSDEHSGFGPLIGLGVKIWSN